MARIGDPVPQNRYLYGLTPDVVKYSAGLTLTAPKAQVQVAKTLRVVQVGVSVRWRRHAVLTSVALVGWLKAETVAPALHLTPVVEPNEDRCRKPCP